MSGYKKILSKIYVILSIPYFLLALLAIADGVMIAFAFCLAFGLLCLFVYHILKTDIKIDERIAEQDTAAEAMAANTRSSCS